jgi:phosphoheptose isomerase
LNVKENRRLVYEDLMDLYQLISLVANTLAPQIEQAANLVTECVLLGRKVLACGNGGSAADAQHFVAELVGRMRRDRQALPAISLSSDPSVVTAVSNDYGYDFLFARQVEGWGQAGDVLVAISTSGRSPNVLRAVETAHRQGLRTIALLGEYSDSVLESCSVCINIPSLDTPRVQEIHMAVLHIICDYVEQQVITNAVHSTKEN